MNSRIACVLCLIAWMLGTSVNASESAGKTIMARGDVSASNNEGPRQLKRRAPVFLADSVKTGLVSATQLRMIDGGLLALQEETELAISTYDFNSQNKQGAVSMELLKGGLRTVTGALQTDKNNYRLKTPIASIGVRGTHYEAEMFNGDLYLAGWDGTIDIVVDTNGRTFSLGPKEKYRFAIVRSDGSVEFLLNVPSQFSSGHSSDLLTSSSIQQAKWQQNVVDSAPPTENINVKLADALDNVGEAFIDNDLLFVRLLPDGDIALRTGAATFDVLASSDFTSTAGSVSNINMSITVDFNNASIPTGNVSFNDSDGEWFAAFNGLINANALDVNVNFASHNNNLADGALNGIFIDSATAILGNVELFEIAQPEVNATGSFLLRERLP